MISTDTTDQTATSIPAQVACLFGEIALARATAFARTGKLDDAAHILVGIADEPAVSAPALDLLARVRAQQGRLAEAQAHWQDALRLEPLNESYQDALRCLSSRLGRRRTLLGVAPSLAMVAMVAVVCGTWCGLNRTVDALGKATQSGIADLQDANVRLTNEITQLHSRVVAPQQIATEAPETVASSVPVAVEGVATTATADGLSITFDKGLFSTRTNLTSGAEVRLQELGTQLRPHVTELSVVVVGCTDNSAMGTASREVFGDAYGLGMARAVTVIEFLRTKCGWDVSDVWAGSRGERDPPFPNDTRADRLRNRTVVIRLQRASDPPK